MTKLQKLTSCSMLVALASVLCVISKLIPAPWLQGGSVTLASMVPIIAASEIFGIKYGLLTSIVFSVLQMIPPVGGFYPPPTQTFISFILVVMLDYILSYSVLGFSGIICKVFKYKKFSYALSGFITVSIRYLCHIMSGLLIWGVYAPEGQTVLYYSVFYNGSYMIPEIIITTGVLIFITPVIERMRKRAK